MESENISCQNQDIDIKVFKAETHDVSPTDDILLDCDIRALLLTRLHLHLKLPVIDAYTKNAPNLILTAQVANIGGKINYLTGQRSHPISTRQDQDGERSGLRKNAAHVYKSCRLHICLPTEDVF